MKLTFHALRKYGMTLDELREVVDRTADWEGSAELTTRSNWRSGIREISVSKPEHVMPSPYDPPQGWCEGLRDGLSGDGGDSIGPKQ